MSTQHTDPASTYASDVATQVYNAESGWVKWEALCMGYIDYLRTEYAKPNGERPVRSVNHISFSVDLEDKPDPGLFLRVTEALEAVPEPLEDSVEISDYLPADDLDLSPPTPPSSDDEEFEELAPLPPGSEDNVFLGPYRVVEQTIYRFKSAKTGDWYSAPMHPDTLGIAYTDLSVYHDRVLVLVGDLESDSEEESHDESYII